MTTDHPQHSTNGSAAEALRVMTHKLRDLSHINLMRGLNLGSPPSREQMLRQAAQQSRPFRVRPAPMPRATSTGEGK
jgi:hypothetical protein